MDVESEQETHARDPSEETSGSASEAESERPTQIGRYMVLQEIGRGGMGVVWTAYDPKLDRKVAIKLLSGSPRKSTRQARFIREAQALAKLNHPNIVTVHDVDTHDGRLYMAMELVDGQTLRRWLKSVRSWREIVEVFILAGRGLAAAHAADITHRDFKPSNVLITRDRRVKVLDFGLAKHMSRDPMGSYDDEISGAHRLDSGAVVGLADPASRRDGIATSSARGLIVRSSDIMEVIGSSANLKLTKHGRIVGTPAYMAPEQYPVLAQHPVGVWTDQFSFAVALFEGLFGELPFAGGDLLETYDNIHAGNVRDPRRDPPVPGWLLKVLHRALREDPRERFESMDALLEALQADPARRRARLTVAVGGAGLFALASFGVAQALSADEPEPCQGAHDHLEGVWDETTSTIVEQGLIATRLPFAADTARRATASFDRYAEDWIAQRTAICEATRIRGEQSETLLDVRMNCLDRRLGELSALVKALSTPDGEAVARAVTAVAELRRPEPCASAQPGSEGALPEDPARRARFLELQAQVDDADALVAAGRHAAARDLAASVAQTASRQGFLRLFANARVIEGMALRRLRDATEAQAVLREGVMAAASVGDVRAEVRAWSHLLAIAGVLLDESKQVAGWQLAAEAALERAGSPKDLGFKLQLNIGGALLAQNRFADATAVGEDALRLALEVGGEGSTQHAKALNNLGIVAAKQADWTLAERRLRESYELKQRLYGPAHPEVASNGMNLANVLGQYAKKAPADQRDAIYDEAERLYRQAVDVRERTDGPNSANVARTLSMIAVVQRNRGKLDEARHSYERAVAILRALPGDEADLARTLNNLAQLDRSEHNYERANAYHREALEIASAKYGDVHLSVGQTRLQLCQTLSDAERYGQAVRECRKALDVLERVFEERPNPALVSAHSLLSLAHAALGHTGDATIHRSKAAEYQQRLDAAAEAPSP